MNTVIHKENLVGWENLAIISNNDQIERIKDMFLSEGNYYKLAKNIYLIVFCVLLYCSILVYILDIQTIYFTLVMAVLMTTGILSIVNSKLYLRKLRKCAKDGRINILKCHFIHVDISEEGVYGHESKVKTIYGEICYDTFIIDFRTAKRYLEGYKDNIIIVKCLDTYKVVNLSL